MIIVVRFVSEICLVANHSVASFTVSLTSRLPAKSLQNVVVELNLGEGASGIKCITSKDAGNMRRGMDVPGSSGASWSFDSRKKVRSFLVIHDCCLISKYSRSSSGKFRRWYHQVVGIFRAHTPLRSFTSLSAIILANFSTKCEQY